MKQEIAYPVECKNYDVLGLSLFSIPQLCVRILGKLKHDVKVNAQKKKSKDKVRDKSDHFFF